MKAQADIITFAVLAVVIIIIAPIMMTVFRESVGGFTSGLNAVSNSTANEAAKIGNTFTSMYDIVVITVFLVALIMLIVTSFLIEVHPIFIVFYILTAIFTMTFIPSLLQPAESIWSSDIISAYTVHLPMTQFILDNYSAIMLVVIVLTGIITYAKIRGSQNAY